MRPMTDDEALRKFSLGMKAIGYAVVLVAAASFPTLAKIAGAVIAAGGLLIVFVVYASPTAK